MDSHAPCSVEYPAAVFATERTGIFPFERFAYNVLRIGAEALAASSQLPCVSVAFDPHGRADPAAVNAWIQLDSTGAGYRIETTPFTPPLLLSLCHTVLDPLFSQPTISQQWLEDPSQLVARVKHLQELARSARSILVSEGLGAALVHLRDHGGYGIYSKGSATDFFDGVVQFIACHEAAHAYVKQFSRPAHSMAALDAQAFEFVADLVATSWLYRRLIVHTPDNPDYRRFRGARTHNHALRLNVQYVLGSQLAFVAFLGLGEIIHRNAPARLEGGPTHPHTVMRYFIQQVHFMTLVESNFPKLLQRRHQRDIGAWWTDSMTALHSAGLVPDDTRSVLTSDAEYMAVRRAGELAQELDLPETRKAAPFLLSMSAAPAIAAAARRERRNR